MSQPFKIHEVLSRAELDELETFAREPGRTVDECMQWLLERGFRVSHGAVGNWLREFRGLLMKERFSGSAQLAQAIKSTVEKGSFGDVAEASVMQLTQVIFEQASALQSEGKIDPLDVQRWTRSLRNVIGSKEGLLSVAMAKFDAEFEAAKRKSTDGTITPEAVAEARKRIFGN